jgi:hypothetical protein
MENLCILPVNNNFELKQRVEKFLSDIDSIDSLDIDLLDNGACITNNEEIIGYITFESYSEYGLIRYFIFQKRVDIEKIFAMFHQLVDIASSKQITSLISIGKNDEVIRLFEMLGFYKIDPNNLIVNGRTIRGTDLETASILKYDVNE